MNTQVNQLIYVMKYKLENNVKTTGFRKNLYTAG